MARALPVWQVQKNGAGWEAVNQMTGEVLPLAPFHGSRGEGREPHVWLFQERIKRLAEHNPLGQQSMRVLLYLLGVLDWDNWLVVPHTAMVRALQMSAPNVSRAVAQLVDAQILRQAEPPAPRTAYRLNSAYAYKGKYAALKKRRREEAATRQAQRGGEAQPR